MLSISTGTFSAKPANSGRRLRSVLSLKSRMLVFAGIELAGMVAGCGGVSTTGAKAGPISITASSASTGTVSSLTLTGTAKLSMTPVGDKSNAGVDWTVTCGGSPVTGTITNGACGTLAPTHTAGGATTTYTAPSVVPIGTTVTISATVTSNASQSSSVSLTIISAPLSLSFVPGFAGPSSLDVNTTAKLIVTVTNDSSNAGVLWTATCGSAACGSFNPAQTSGTSLLGTTYTAPSAVPAGGTVTLTATSVTDTTKSVSSTVTITKPPAASAISVSVTPSALAVTNSGSGRTAHPVAVVLNDSAAAGVDWSLSCTNCGSITSHTSSGTAATFLASSSPAVGSTITIKATSTSDSTKTATATVTVVNATPITISISTAPSSTLKTGATANLAATASSGSDGINWTATCGSTGACGSFNPAHTASGGQTVYTAPASVPTGGLVTMTASSAAMSPSNAAVAFTTIVASPVSPTLSFTQTPPASLVSTASTPVSVTVANDPSSEDVTWSVQCGSSVAGGCGWLSPVTTASGVETVYTAPPATTAGTSVTLTATSVANTSVSITSSAITITPDTRLTVSFIPSLPAQVQPNATVNLNAAVAHDTTNAGVDWKVCASGCGFFTIKPAVAEVYATSTTSDVPAQPAVTATSVTAWPNGLLIPYTAPTEAPSSGTVAVVARAHADTSIANSGTIAINSLSTGPALNGIVKVGTTPVVGASVALYAAGTSGYASAAAQIAAASSDKSGSFSIPASYTCPLAASQMYLVATGGTVRSNDANSNLALMTALGSCGNLGSSSVVVNEATTVASAWATAPFAANDALTGNSSYLYLGTSSSNQIGLANAFAAVNNLVDISTGKVRFVVPAGNATVPYVEINTLANFLNACAATSGGVEGDGSACGTLFGATDLLGDGTFGSSIAPSDTLQAAFNIAQHPAPYNYGYRLDRYSTTFPLMGLATTSSPFQPVFTSTSTPSDWSISLNYTSGGGLSSASTVGSFAIDASGDVWITDTAAGSVIEWNAVGAAQSPSTGFSAGGGPIAIDASGNVWVSGDGALYELSNLGAAYPWSPTGGVAGGGGDMAIDAESNLWITSSTGVYEFNSLGQKSSPSDGYTNDTVTNVSAVGIDSSDNVWLADRNNAENQNLYAEITNPGGQLVYNGKLPGSENFPEIAADGAGKTWALGSNLVSVIPAYGGKGATLQATSYDGGGTSAGGSSGLDFWNARGIALDGAGTAWIANQGGHTNPVIPPGVLPIALSLSDYTAAVSYTSSSLGAGTLRVAVDGAGNVWVLLADNSVTEYVGAATPVVMPLALGVQKKKLGAKP